MDKDMKELYEISVKKMEGISETLAPLIAKEEELQKKLAPIRQELKAVCAEINKIKKETDFYTHNNRIMRWKGEYNKEPKRVLEVKSTIKR